jgi:5-methylcytosine-specific restriction protein A
MTLAGPFSSTPRSEFSQATKKAALKRSGGRCEGIINAAGERCPMLFTDANPPEVDHKTEAADGGDASLENAQCLGKRCCHQKKTKVFVTRIRKADRQSREGHWLKRATKKKIPSRPFSKWTPPRRPADPDT